MKLAQFRQTKLAEHREVYEKGKYGTPFTDHQGLIDRATQAVNQYNYPQAAWYLGLADKVAKQNANNGVRRRFRMRGMRADNSIRRKVPTNKNQKDQT